MKITKTNKADLTFIEVNNEINLKVTLCSLGASIFSIFFNDEIMTLTPRDIKDFLKENIYYGKSIGTICGRIKKGHLVIDNKEYLFDTNEGENTLHGGVKGLSALVFDVDVENDKVIFTRKDKISTFKIIYEFQENEDTFTIRFDIESTKETPLALTNHAYYCLGDETIDNLTLKIPANKYIEVDTKEMIPLGDKEIIPSLDFRRGKLIIKDIDDPYLVNSRTNGIDHSLIFEKDAYIALSNDRYLMEITSDFDAVQLYSDNYVDNVYCVNSNQLTHRAIAIEPQDNQLKRSVYSSYKRFITYKFSKIN